jgi:hypothetical protein
MREPNVRGQRGIGSIVFEVMGDMGKESSFGSDLLH